MVAKTMTTGTLDAALPFSANSTVDYLDPVTPIPSDWAEEHFVVEELIKAARRSDLGLASSYEAGLTSEDVESVTDARHSDEFYPGAHEYNFDIDDYCISRGGFDESEAERIALEEYHQARLEEDRITAENRERARFEMSLIAERAMAERRRLDRAAIDQAQIEALNASIEQWTSVEWPDEQLRA